MDRFLGLRFVINTTKTGKDGKKEGTGTASEAETDERTLEADPKVKKLPPCIEKRITLYSVGPWLYRTGCKKPLFVFIGKKCRRSEEAFEKRRQERALRIRRCCRRLRVVH